MSAAINNKKKGHPAQLAGDGMTLLNTVENTMSQNVTITAPQGVLQDPDLLTLERGELAAVLREHRPPGVSDEQIDSLAARFDGTTIRVSAVLAAAAELKAGGAR